MLTSEADDLSSFGGGGPAQKILLLAGTREARELARRLARWPGLEVTASLAGAVKRPKFLDVPTRIGGFGGAEGLRDYLLEHEIDVVVDATHPYAVQISANACLACAHAGVRLLRLERPEWRAQEGDRWLHCASAAAAARALPFGARVFLSIGRKEISAFHGRDDLWRLMRMIDPLESEAPPRGKVVLALPSACVEEEAELLAQYDVDCVVSKNSGGESAYAKILAARRLGLPVYMIDRPQVAFSEALSVNSSQYKINVISNIDSLLCEISGGAG